MLSAPFFLVLIVAFFVLKTKKKTVIPQPVEEGYSTIVKYEGTGAPMVDINVHDHQPLIPHRRVIPEEAPADISEFIRTVSTCLLQS